MTTALPSAPCQRTLTFGLLLTASLWLLGACSLGLPEPARGGAPQQVAEEIRPEPEDLAAKPWIEGLEAPWSLVFLEADRALVSERPGRIRAIVDGRLQAEPYAELEAAAGGERGLAGAALEATIGGEGGVLGLAVHPDFPARPYIYAYHTLEGPEGVRNRVVRLRHEDPGDGSLRGRFDRVILDGIPGWVFHNGGRLGFGPDGLLYITTGETFEAELAQNPESLGGKILRLDPEGGIPESNPFPGSPVYSLGHRNPQGLAWEPESGQLFASEHGPSAEFGLGAHDEVNVIRPGGNYGWPRVVGAAGLEGYADPLIAWTEETTPPAGMAFHQGDLYVASLASEALLRIGLQAENGGLRVTGIERLFVDDASDGSLGRLRDVVAGPDGRLYLLTSNRDGRGNPRPGDDRIYRLDPR